MKTYTIALTEFDEETQTPQMLVGVAPDGEEEHLEDQMVDALNHMDSHPVVELFSGLTLLGLEETYRAEEAGAKIIYKGDDYGVLCDESGEEYYAAGLL